ncbi:hypothetical protein E4O92_01640 [Massilia horti]|uniref:Uncharacterized protein n=1 Tax=Massilia horti TaxID=2562153 RepID=A0A4Y9T5W2_9BURK|nr:hypothetical protein E4O92_01640 [Massilia horti]
MKKAAKVTKAEEAQAKSPAKPKTTRPTAKTAAKSGAKVLAKPAAAKSVKTAAKPAPGAKVAAKSAVKAVVKAAAKTAKAPAKAAPVAAAPIGNPKLVRDSFTMPEQEYAVLAEAKKACLKAGFEIKKSELLRIGVALVGQLDAASLQAVLATLPQLKTGRPRAS